jgi:putative glutamine amidotransferase
MSPPLVAVPGFYLPAERISRWEAGGFALPTPYVAALLRAGAWPVILPPVAHPRPGQLLSGVSGLVLAGGGDVDPARYGQRSHPAVYGVHSERDELELALVRAARERGLPVLAICRGMQVVNVACGGSLWQHLPDRKGWEAHGDPTGVRSIRHDVEVEAGSRLAAAVGVDPLSGCLSHHHQGVAEVGRGLTPVARTGDGLVEALEPVADGPWLLAVQWHPEENAGHDSRQQALFDAFVRQLDGVGD